MSRGEVTSYEASSSEDGTDPADLGTNPIRLGILVVAVQFGLGLNLFSVAPLLPLIIDDYDTSRTVAGLLVAVPVLFQAATGLPGSVVVARFGSKRTLSVGGLMVSCAVLTPLFPGFFFVLLLRLVAGAGAGLILASTGPVIMSCFPSRHVPTMNTLFLVALSGGIALGVFAAAPLAEAVGWREALAIVALGALLPTLVWATIGIDATQTEHRSWGLRQIRTVLSNRTVLSLVVADALVFVQYAVLTTWLPTFLYEHRGMSLERAGFITGLLPGVGVIAVVAGGVIAHRYRPWRPLLMISGLVIGVSGFATFLVSDHRAIAVAVMVLGVGTWIYQPAFHTIPMELPWMTADRVAVVWGASMTIAGIGQFVAPIVVGASRDLFDSFVPGFILWSVLAWSLVVVGATFPSPPKRSTSGS